MTRDDITDRELLELAAKAAGATWIDDNWPEDLPGLMLDFGKGTTQWSPLADDGDALRLAVRCGITVTPFKKDIVSDVEFQFFSRYAWWFGGKKVDCHDADQYAATRRAIVHVAAEIGRNMK